MKRFLHTFLLLFFCLSSMAQMNNFRIAFISDTHIGSPDGKAEEDLKRTVSDINSQSDLDFAVITGDITELGTDLQLQLAKKILDTLRIKYYIIPGNHDDGWSESGGDSFIKIFSNDKFLFDHKGIRFIGCPSGPYVRMSDGHVPRSDINWMKTILDTTSSVMPIVFLNHYPINDQLDNWYEVLDILKKKNTILIMCGHGHTNKAFSFEEIPGVMGRSNLRAKALVGGYNIAEFANDSITFAERNPLTRQNKIWTSVKISLHSYNLSKKFIRPDFSINNHWNNVHIKWITTSTSNIISTPALINNLVVIGNQNGTLEGLSVKTGKREWAYQTGGAIYSSPAVKNDRIVFGSTDGSIYCLTRKGKLAWRFRTQAAVLGSPIIQNDIIYIGGSDHNFRAIQLSDGKLLWKFSALDGPITSTPIIHQDKIIFGAWDTYLYSININDGSLVWKWNNGSPIRNYSPAACIPVARDSVIYIVAPDRYLTAIDAIKGNTIWKTNESTVRESIGISENGELVYGKTMSDTLAAFHTGKVLQKAAWKLNVGFGYEHVPSMIVERNGIVYFGTRNGVVYAVNVTSKKVEWAYKIDNSMVNTVRLLNRKSLIVTTMDGKVALLEEK